MTDNTLGWFLRTRREAVRPAEVGLPNGGRRRTPGLRRAELATLAGVSVDYLVRLEQGRDRHPSAQVLGALADALQLGPDERLLLLRTAKTSAGRLCPAAEAPAQRVRPTVRALLERLEPAPACVLNRLGDMLAHTTGYATLAGPAGLLDADPPNLIRFLFGDPRSRAVFPDWDRLADEQIVRLKIEINRGDPHLAELVDALTVTAGAAFTTRWQTPPDRLASGTGQQRWAHPEAGELRLAYETLALPDADDQRLVVYLPADDATSVALERLAAPAVSR